MTKRTRKRIDILLTVSVPISMPATKARKEVKTLINDQCNYHNDVDESDIRVISIKGAPK